jgi:hypothetical protein
MSPNRQIEKDFSLESFFHSHPVFQVPELEIGIPERRY